MAFKALMVNQILSTLIIVIIIAAVGVPFSGGVVQVINLGALKVLYIKQQYLYENMSSVLSKR